MGIDYFAIAANGLVVGLFALLFLVALIVIGLSDNRDH